MDPLFEILERTRGVTQSDDYHPEGDVFIHSVQTMRWAFRETDDTDLILAAMLHDVGKIAGSKGHEEVSVRLVKDLVSVKTCWLIENHMRVWYWLLGNMKKFSKVKNMADHPWLPELVQLARFDKLGRNPNSKVQYDKTEIVGRLVACSERHFRCPEPKVLGLFDN